MAIKKSVLMDALKRVMPTVARHNTQELLRCFIFRDNLLSTWDGGSGTATTSPLENMDFAVNADRFYSVANSLHEEAEFTYEDNTLHIHSGGFKTKLATNSTKGFPDIIPTGMNIFSEATNLAAAVKSIGFSASTNPIRPATLGVAFSGDHCYSSDGKCISRAKLDKPCTGTLQVKWESLKQVIDLGQPTNMFATESQMGAFYQDTNTVYVSGTLPFKFPCLHVDKIFAAPTQFVIDFPAVMSDTISRVSLSSDKDDPGIFVNINKDGIVVSAKCKDSTAEELLDFTYPNECRFFATTDRIKKILSITLRADLSDVLVGGQKQIRFIGDGFDHIMGLRAIKE